MYELFLLLGWLSVLAGGLLVAALVLMIFDFFTGGRFR